MKISLRLNDEISKLSNTIMSLCSEPEEYILSKQTNAKERKNKRKKIYRFRIMFPLMFNRIKYIYKYKKYIKWYKRMNFRHALQRIILPFNDGLYFIQMI